MHHLYDIAIPLLYKRKAKKGNHDVKFRAVERGRIGTLKHIAEYLYDGPRRRRRGVDAQGITTHQTTFDPETDAVTGPLHVAAEHGQVDTVEFLLNHGADIDAPSMTQRDLGLGIGIDSYSIDFQEARSIQTAGPPPQVSPFSPLIAANSRQHDVTELLLRRGASVDIRETGSKLPCGATALHVAIINGNVEAIKMIHRRRIRTRGQTIQTLMDRYPPLLWAGSINDDASAASMQPLLGLGADVNYFVPQRFLPGITTLAGDYPNQVMETILGRGTRRPRGDTSQ